MSAGKRRQRHGPENRSGEGNSERTPIGRRSDEDVIQWKSLGWTELARNDTSRRSSARRLFCCLLASPWTQTTHAEEREPTLGARLYAQHCAACHGERGDGLGRAAAFLFPKPRDFRRGRFRLVSTANGVPTREDLDAVLQRGMPGSAMPPWHFLSAEERRALIDQIYVFLRDGLREAYIARYQEEEGLTDEELKEELADPDFRAEIEEFVRDRSTPGELTSVPDLGQPTQDALAEGKRIYVAQGCVSCHGETGKGDGVKKMVDDEGYPTRPRDFTRGIFKGGHDAASLYRRTAYGMPGTPMPATNTLTPVQIAKLVHWIRSLSDEPTRQEAIVRRVRIPVKRVASLPDKIRVSSPLWDQAEATAVHMIPTWWRDDFPTRVVVAAIHDGKELAIRLTWQDATPNWTSHRTTDFPDAVAVELFTGKQEPFLGMGSSDGPVEIWYDNADRETRWPLEKVYPRIMVGMYPFSEVAVDRATYARPGTKDSAQPKLSLPAVSAGNPITPRAGVSAAAALEAAGPQTLTFRPLVNWKVRAAMGWKQGQWRAVFRRPLDVDPKEGNDLSPGGHYSIGFAVFDGAHRDRNGQKLFTIWNDFVLDP